jgi:AraC-like DNA-binding protein
MSIDGDDRDRARFVRPRFLPGVELVSVAYRDRVFPTHMHPEYVVGTVVSGAEELRVGGAEHVVGAGDVLRLHPGEPHANRCLGGETLRYRVFYLPGESIAPYLDGETDLSFAGPVVRAPALARLLATTHETLCHDGTGELEQESAMLGLIEALAADRNVAAAPAATGAAVERARDYIDAHFADGFGLATLAEVADLSVFHLAHSFRKATGFSPLAYRNQLRVSEARRMLLAGERIADVAAAVGFADQSHLTRHFQRIFGVSPGRYAQQ